MKEWDEKRSVMQRYDSTAHIYDMRYSEEQASKIEAAMKNVTIGKEGLVLDVGCGTGLLFSYVANKAKATVGLDISRKILFQAEKRAEKFADVHLILADADNLPLKDEVFSCLFAVTLLQNMPNPSKTLSEIRRVTKENSFMIITGLKKKFPLETFEGLLRDAGLKVITLENESLRCHVAVCTKLFC